MVFVPARDNTPDVTAGAPTKPSRAYDVGDNVVHSNHGAATITAKVQREHQGVQTDVYILETVTKEMKVEMPAATAAEKLRPVISKTGARQVFTTLKAEPQEAGGNWARWYKLLTEKMNSGDILQVAEVVRDLTHINQVKGISPALKRMLANAREVLVSELRFALDLSEEDTVKRLDRALPKGPPADA